MSPGNLGSKFEKRPFFDNLNFRIAEGQIEDIKDIYIDSLPLKDPNYGYSVKPIRCIKNIFNIKIAIDPSVPDGCWEFRKCCSVVCDKSFLCETCK